MTIRFPSTAFRTWLDQVRAGEDESVALRALMVLGAAALGLEGASREAQRLLAADLPSDVIDALQAAKDGSQPIPTPNTGMSDKRLTNVGQASDKRQTNVRQTIEDPMIEPDADPFAGVGLSV